MVFLLASGLALPVFSAEPVETENFSSDPDEVAELLKTDPVKTVGSLRLLADKNDSRAMLLLAECAYRGIGMKPDKKLTLALLERAADAGESAALLNLGKAYETGALGESSLEKSAAYYRAAVIRGNVRACVPLGKFYLRGAGVPKNETVAAGLFRTAAKADDPAGLNLLGVLTFSGRGGIAPDHAEAEKLFRRAAALGYAPAMNNLGWIARFEQSKESLPESFRWFEMAAKDRTYLPAVHNLALAYANGFGIKTDFAKARALAEFAAARGFAPSMHLLGMMDLFGLGTEKNPAAAFRHYLAAAKANYRFAQIQVAQMYREGVGTAKNEPEATRWEKIAFPAGREKSGEPKHGEPDPVSDLSPEN